MEELKYKTPAVRTYSAVEIVEIIGPTQAASINLNGYRGTKLELPEKHEYRYVENKIDNKIVHLNAKGGIENA